MYMNAEWLQTGVEHVEEVKTSLTEPFRKDFLFISRRSVLNVAYFLVC